MANPNIYVEGIDEIVIGGSRLFDVPVTPNLPAVPTPSVVTNVATEAALAERGGQALANAYSEYFLDTLGAEIDLAAESALRRSDDAAAVTRALADYEVAGIRVGVRRAEEAVIRAGARIAAAAAANLPEVVISASRVIGGVPFTLATGLVEGAYYLGSWLSDLATRSYRDRIPPERPPPVALAPPPAREPDPAPPVLVLPDDPVTVDVTAPRPVAQPVTPRLPTLVNPLVTPYEPTFAMPLPTPTRSPTVPLPGLTYDPVLVSPPRVSTPTASPAIPPFSLATPLGVPGLVDVSTPGGRAPPRVPSPTNQNRCRCDEPKKKRKRKKPREVCYRGEYVERSKGLLKFRERKIPCQ